MSRERKLKYIDVVLNAKQLARINKGYTVSQRVMISGALVGVSISKKDDKLTRDLLRLKKKIAQLNKIVKEKKHGTENK